MNFLLNVSNNLLNYHNPEDAKPHSFHWQNPISHANTCFLEVSYVLPPLIVSMFPFRSWAHNLSQVLVHISELWGYITKFFVNHFLTQPTVHHVWRSRFELTKDCAVSWKKSAKNYNSWFERKYGECSVLASTEKNFTIFLPAFTWSVN
jgi:hypothetical protein